MGKDVPVPSGSEAAALARLTFSPSRCKIMSRLFLMLLPLVPAIALTAETEPSGCGKIGSGLLNINKNSTVNYKSYHAPITGPYLETLGQKAGKAVEGQRVDKRDSGPIEHAKAPDFEVITDKNTKQVLWITQHAGLSERAAKDVAIVGGYLFRKAGKGDVYSEPSSAWTPSSVTYYFTPGAGNCHLDHISAVIDGKEQVIGSVAQCKKMTQSIDEQLTAASDRRVKLRAEVAEALNDIDQRQASVSFSPSKIGASDKNYEEWQKQSLRNFEGTKQKERDDVNERKKRILADDAIESFKKSYHDMCLAFPEIMEEIKNDFNAAAAKPTPQAKSVK
jgi:hypothetical protein